MLSKFQDYFKSSRLCANPKYLLIPLSHVREQMIISCHKISDMNLRQASLTQTMHGYSSTTTKRFAMKLYLVTVAGKKARNTNNLQSCIFTKSTLCYKYWVNINLNILLLLMLMLKPSASKHFCSKQTLIMYFKFCTKISWHATHVSDHSF